jgi:hypothetical protein
MMLALDYDETYTRDPAFWDAVIQMATQRGHSVICATMRYEHEGQDVVRDLGNKVESIIFTGRKAKYGAVSSAGYVPHIWIDDNPHWIYIDAAA